MGQIEGQPNQTSPEMPMGANLASETGLYNPEMVTPEVLSELNNDGIVVLESESRGFFGAITDGLKNRSSALGKGALRYSIPVALLISACAEGSGGEERETVGNSPTADVTEIPNPPKAPTVELTPTVPPTATEIPTPTATATPEKVIEAPPCQVVLEEYCKTAERVKVFDSIRKIEYTYIKLTLPPDTSIFSPITGQLGKDEAVPPFSGKYAIIRPPSAENSAAKFNGDIAFENMFNVEVKQGDVIGKTKDKGVVYFTLNKKKDSDTQALNKLFQK